MMFQILLPRIPAAISGALRKKIILFILRTLCVFAEMIRRHNDEM